jgi:geranylgeranyl pyrophosphate synthase
MAAGASEELAAGIERFGAFIGRIVQIQDDLTDALEPGNDSDWRPPISNVALRYALHVDHADRESVRQLLPSAGAEGDARHQIRRILATCGAIEYGMSNVLFYADEARRYLARQPVEQRYLTEFLDRLTAPTRNVLGSLGVSPDDVSQHLVHAFGSATPPS